MNSQEGDRRRTVRTIRSGQSGSYSDTRHTYQVFFEWVPYDTRIKPEDRKYIPNDFTDEVMIIQELRKVSNWYDRDKMPDPFVPTLEYIKKLGPGLWEFSTREAYND